jgi:hypothetical protein
VGGHDHDEVGRLEILFEGDRLEVGFWQRGDMRVVVGELGAARPEQLQDLQGGRFAQVADTRLVGDSEEQDARPCTGLPRSLRVRSILSTQK